MAKSTHLRHLVLGVVASAVFAFTWFLRFNDPNGSFAGLTDDHFFYVVRGWQLLYGDLPARDFVDHGAPLHFYMAAAVQLVFGRGTLSELAFTTSMLAAGAALTFWLAARASGSIVAGLLGAGVHIHLFPRFYNYPKVVVYAAAIPLLWSLVDKPGPGARFWLAVTTAIAFLLRHDHGVYVALAVALSLVLAGGMSWRERLRHGALYAVLTAALLAPYVVFVELNGGVSSYIQQTASWAARERERTPMEWPGLFDDTEERPDMPAVVAPIWVVRDNATAWWYYLELLLPVLALAVAAVSRDAFRPAWVQGRVKVAMVALVGIILNAGFLRSPLEARLADPSVPHAILIAWLAWALLAMFREPASWAAWVGRGRVPLAASLAGLAAPIAFVLAATLTHGTYDRLSNAGLTEGPRRVFQGATSIARSLRADWQLANRDDRAERSELMTLVRYVNVCTPPNARIFVQPYIPQVLALARRAFAGGHADLRPGFFTSEADQQLTLSRLRRQHVPVVLLATDDSLANFREAFPVITAYLDERYAVAGTHVFDGRFGITLLVDRAAGVGSRFADLDWPCVM